MSASQASPFIATGMVIILGASLILFYHSSQASPFLVIVLRMIRLITILGSIDIFPAAHTSKAGGGADHLYLLGRSSKALSARILILVSSIGTCGCDSNAKNVLFQTSAYASFFNSDGIEEEQRKKMNFQSGEPLFTHFTSRFIGTLDYIFYTGILEQQIFLTFIMHQILTSICSS